MNQAVCTQQGIHNLYKKYIIEMRWAVFSKTINWQSTQWSSAGLAMLARSKIYFDVILITNIRIRPTEAHGKTRGQAGEVLSPQLGKNRNTNYIKTWGHRKQPFRRISKLSSYRPKPVAQKLHPKMIRSVIDSLHAVNKARVSSGLIINDLHPSRSNPRPPIW